MPQVHIRKVLWTHSGANQEGKYPVKIYVYHNKKQRYYPSMVYVRREHWDETKREVIKANPSYKLLNHKIEAFYVKVKWHFDNDGSHQELKDILAGVDTTSTKSNLSFIEFLDHFISEIDKGSIDGIADSRGYQSLSTRIHDYIQFIDKDDLLFDDIDMPFYYSFKEYLYDNGNSHGGVDKHIKNIISIMNKSFDRELHENLTYQKKAFARIRYITEKTYLNENEIDLIQNLDLSRQHDLEIERDRFIIQYYLLLRISDVMRLRKHWMFKQNNRSYIRVMHQQKTKKEAIIPIKPIILELLEQYDYQLNFTSDVAANKAIKMIGLLAGIDYDVTLNGVTKPKHQLITTHTARRSAATNLYLRKTPLKLISDLGGWKNIKTMMTYIRASGLDSAIVASDLDFYK